jgi:archaemetzincin
MHQKKTAIGVFAFGDIPPVYLQVIAAHISGYLKLDADILPSLGQPEYALDEHRFQYDCGVILKTVNPDRFKGYEKVVGVLTVDLFVPIFTHVYGEARQGGKIALVSTYRLQNNPRKASVPSSLIYERTAKVAMHELGHLFNLSHCDDNKCLMHFSGSLNDLDHIPVYFCRYCTAYFRDAVEHQ